MKSTIDCVTPYVDLNDRTTNYGVRSSKVKPIHQGVHKLRNKCYHARFYQNRYDTDNVTPKSVDVSDMALQFSYVTVYDEDFEYDETSGKGIFSQ